MKEKRDWFAKCKKCGEFTCIDTTINHIKQQAKKEVFDDIGEVKVFKFKTELRVKDLKDFKELKKKHNIK